MDVVLGLPRTSWARHRRPSNHARRWPTLSVAEKMLRVLGPRRPVWVHPEPIPDMLDNAWKIFLVERHSLITGVI